MSEPAARIHVATPSPPYCAACYGAKPNEVHVDFGAATDGPMLTALDGAVGVVGHSVDDVIICRTCIEEAAKLVGLGDVAKLQAELEAEREANERLHDLQRQTREGVTGALQEALKRARGDSDSPVATIVNGNLPITTKPAAPRKRPARRR